MTRRVLNIFQQRFFKRLCSLINLNRTRVVVHLVVGIHIADVAVPDQVHVTSYLFLTLTNGSCVPRGVTCVNFYKSDQIFTIVNFTVQNWCQNASY